MAMPSGRFFGWVIGGTLPAALGADWLTGAWDQNAGMRYATPGVVAAEEAAAGWLLDLLGLPPGSAVGFTTGATMASFTGLAAARQHVLARAGWDVERLGLAGGPKVTVLVGAERHDSVDLALRYLGLGAPTPVAADDQGRVVPAALADALAAAEGPTIVVLQAGNLHSGAYDPFDECISRAHDHGAWVHVDGAFGLWAAASPALRHLVAGVAGADSWATDAHKTLNVPYDCGVCVVADPSRCRPPWACRPATSSAPPTCPTPSTRSPSCCDGHEGCRSGRRCDRSGAPVSQTWWRGSPRTPAASLTASPPSRAPRCSTTWCSPRSASPSATTPGPGRSPRGCSPTARPGCPGSRGAAATSCGSR